MAKDIVPHLLDFWGCPPPLPKAERGISFYDLTDDPHDPENWRLIATRFPDLADLLPDWCLAESSQIESQKSQLQADVERVKHLGEGASLADISEVLTGRRTYGGSIYERVKDVQKALKTSTTTPSERIGAGSSEKKAA